MLLKIDCCRRYSVFGLLPRIIWWSKWKRFYNLFSSLENKHAEKQRSLLIFTNLVLKKAFSFLDSILSLDSVLLVGEKLHSPIFLIKHVDTNVNELIFYILCPTRVYDHFGLCWYFFKVDNLFLKKFCVGQLDCLRLDIMFFSQSTSAVDRWAWFFSIRLPFRMSVVCNGFWFAKVFEKFWKYLKF